MNVLEMMRSPEVESGEEFGKGPKGPWFKKLPDGSFHCTSVPSKPGSTMTSRGLTVFHGDFLLDTWQLRPKRADRVDAKEFMGRVDAVLNMLRTLISELVPKEGKPE